MKSLIKFPFYVLGIALIVLAAGIAIIGYFNVRLANEIGD